MVGGWSGGGPVRCHSVAGAEILFGAAPGAAMGVLPRWRSQLIFWSWVVV